MDGIVPVLYYALVLNVPLSGILLIVLAYLLHKSQRDRRFVTVARLLTYTIRGMITVALAVLLLASSTILGSPPLIYVIPLQFLLVGGIIELCLMYYERKNSQSPIKTE